MHFEHYDNERLKAQLSGERFTVTYELTGTEAECRTIANEICVEQSIGSRRTARVMSRRNSN